MKTRTLTITYYSPIFIICHFTFKLLEYSVHRWFWPGMLELLCFKSRPNENHHFLIHFTFTWEENPCISLSGHQGHITSWLSALARCTRTAVMSINIKFILRMSYNVYTLPWKGIHLIIVDTTKIMWFLHHSSLLD